MSKHYFIGILLAILVFSIHTARARRKTPYDRDDYGRKGEFDVFALAQIWPQTNCWYLNYGNSRFPIDYKCNPCKRPEGNNTWTLQGLWPHSQNRRHPSYCTRNAPFDLNLLSQDLRDVMTRYWPAYSEHYADRVLWQIEWTEHGTCALEVEETNTQAKYFAKAVELLKSYNLGKILERSGVTPGHEYSLDTIYQALNEALKVNVHVECARLPENTKQHIEQVLVCFDKDFELEDCYNSNSSNCNKNRTIVYPSIMDKC